MMISREKAKDIILWALPAEWSMRKYNMESSIDEIYDSIGSCGACRHYEDCPIISILGQEDDWFCADFERKS